MNQTIVRLRKVLRFAYGWEATGTRVPGDPQRIFRLCGMSSTRDKGAMEAYAVLADLMGYCESMDPKVFVKALEPLCRPLPPVKRRVHPDTLHPVSLRRPVSTDTRTLQEVEEGIRPRPAYTDKRLLVRGF